VPKSYQLLVPRCIIGPIFNSVFSLSSYLAQNTVYQQRKRGSDVTRCHGNRGVTHLVTYTRVLYKIDVFFNLYIA